MDSLSCLNRAGSFAWAFARFLFHAVKPFAVGVVCVLALLGGAAVYDAARADSAIPTPRPIPGVVVGRQLCGDVDAMSKAERWQQMQPALALLDKACPEVSAWCRDMWDRGRLGFETGDTGRWAYYWPAGDYVCFNTISLSTTDAALACIIAHEFRHSRQTCFLVAYDQLQALFGKPAYWCRGEREARQFEEQVRRAIAGW